MRDARLPRKIAVWVLVTALAAAAGGFARSSARADDGDSADQAPQNKYRKSRLTSDESEATADKRDLYLTVGEDKAVDLDFEANATINGTSIGNPMVVATTLVKIGDKRQMVFKPLKQGETTVTVRDADGMIRIIFYVHVNGSNLARIASEIRDLLRDVEGVDVRIVGPKIVLEGEVLVPSDFGRISIVANDSAYKEFVLNLTTLSTLGLQVLAKRIKEDINLFAPNVTTRVVNGVIFLEGSVDNIDQSRRADQVAQVYLPEVRPESLIDRDKEAERPSVPRRLIQDFIQVLPPQPKKQEKLVRITVHFVELSKDYDKFFGFLWSPGFTADPTISVGQAPNGTTGASGASFSATLSSLIPKLQSAQDADYARVLKTADIIVRSGQPASIDEETQYPFVVSGANGQVSPGSQPVGLSLGVTPLILGQSEDIQLDMKINQIDYTAPGTGGGPPITTTHKVETKVYVKSNESAAIAGIKSSQVSTSFNKDDPPSGNNLESTNGQAATDPVFQLMHTKNYSKQKSQFVIFVTPQIVDDAADGDQDLKRDFRVRVQ